MSRSEFKLLVQRYYTWRETKNMSPTIRDLYIDLRNRPSGPKIRVYGFGWDLKNLTKRLSETLLGHVKNALKTGQK